MRRPLFLVLAAAFLGFLPGVARGDGTSAPPAPPPTAPPVLAPPSPAAPAAPAPAPAPPPAAPAPTPVAAPAGPLVLGEFPLAEGGVVDGDTIKVVKDGQPTSVRVLGLDAEETFHGKKGDADRQRAEEDFDRYAKEMRGTSPTPVKFATPAGMAAKAFAHEFFHDVRTVRLERDEVGRDTDGYGRLLMHVIVRQGGKDTVFAEELIRAGLSPYFVKYGRSKRFDARFSAAMKEAQAAKRGIFGDAVKHYPDYAERFPWWEERAKQVDAWDAESAAVPADVTRIRLGVAAETDRLPWLLGKRVTLFGSLDRVDDDKFPKRLLFVDKAHDAFPVVVFEDAVWSALDLPRIRRGYSRISGLLSEFHGHLQIKLSSPTDLR